MSSLEPHTKYNKHTTYEVRFLVGLIRGTYLPYARADNASDKPSTSRTSHTTCTDPNVQSYLTNIVASY